MSQQGIFMSWHSLAKVKRFYVAIENLMSLQSCLKLCRDIVYLAS